MEIGIFVTARLGSSRLKKKHLLSVQGRPIIYYLINRIYGAFQELIEASTVKIIIATSDEPENREFERINLDEATVFYGSLRNIPLRHLQAADLYKLDAIIAVDGDDILCSIDGMKRVYAELIKGEEYVKTVGLPFGMNSMGYSVNFLRKSVQQQNFDVLETGWGRIFSESSQKVIDLSEPQYSNESLRFTLDYQADFEFFNKLITGFPASLLQASDLQIVDYVEQTKLHEITEQITTEYWANFHNGIKNENEKISPKLV